MKRSIATSILPLRGKKVILDFDLAALYGVDVKRLNEQVKRNKRRFPEDFMFRLHPKEAETLRSQIATSNRRGGRRYAPYAFTEHGAVMAATVLNSPRAVEMSVLVVRAFVRLRSLLHRHQELAVRFGELEERLDVHDASIKQIIAAIKQLMSAPAETNKKIGFCSARETSAHRLLSAES